MSVLSCENLGIRVGGRALLKDVSLTLRPGELLGIVGTNGAGKTSLLRALVGLTLPATGRVLLADRALGSWPAAARARRLAYLPQSHAVHWPLPGRDLVALGRLPHGDAQRASGRRAIEQAMAATDTQAFGAAIVPTLSGGERARVLLARVLAGEPAVLLADEPLAALDPAHQLRMMALLREQAAAGCAVVVVLHDLALATRYCTRLIVLHQGRLLAEGAPAKVLDEPTLAQAFGIEALRLHHGGEDWLLPWRLAAAPASGHRATNSPANRSANHRANHPPNIPEASP